MKPVLNEGVWVFSVLSQDADLSLLSAVATFREKEGITVVVDEEGARQRGMKVLFRAAWITISVHSDLHAVGLTAAFSGALAEAGVSCNVMAGAFHDHLFVPVEMAQKALSVLWELQKGSINVRAQERSNP